jgi:uncharacterized repeat protein (TIGR03803 family)
MKNAVLCVAVVVLGCTMALGQAQEKILYSFSGTDGSRPVSKLMLDGSGNLFGTTQEGGTTNWGTVFELSPQQDGTWSETVIYNFCQNFDGHHCLDGAFPEASLIADHDGNLYGTTYSGGSCPDNGSGCGIVFELSPPTPGNITWQETVLYTFCEVHTCPDGAEPLGKLTFDSEGNLYGTTKDGGGAVGGVVFELSPTPSGWTESVLYRFCSIGQFPYCPDGFYPMAGVTFDKSGNLFGTTNVGGSPNSEGLGVLFKLSPGQSGWTESVIKPGGLKNGYFPVAEVNFDSKGNLYCTATEGGLGAGVVYRLSPDETKHQIFSFNGNDGEYPYAGVLIDPRNGNLYGTTLSGGFGRNFNCQGGCGTVYKIDGQGETLLYSFLGGTDGAAPMAGLAADKQGHLYGTTNLGGANNQGAVFEIIP